MLDIIFVYLVNPVKEVMAELLPIFIAPIKILFEIFIRYIEVEGWYVVIMFPFIMAFYFWFAYKIFSIVCKITRRFTRKPCKSRSRREAASKRIHGSKDINTDTTSMEEKPWYAYDPTFEELYEQYCDK